MLSLLDGLQELYMRREVGAAAGEHVGPQLAQLSSSGKLGSDTGSCHWRRWCATQQSRLLPGGRWYLTPLAVASTVAAAPCIAAGRRGPLARQHGSSRLVRSINCQHVTDGLYGHCLKLRHILMCMTLPIVLSSNNLQLATVNRTTFQLHKPKHLSKCHATLPARATLGSSTNTSCVRLTRLITAT